MGTWQWPLGPSFMEPQAPKWVGRTPTPALAAHTSAWCSLEMLLTALSSLSSSP